MSREIKLHENLTRMTGTLLKDQCQFFIVSRSVVRRMGDVWDKMRRENQNL